MEKSINSKLSNNNNTEKKKLKSKNITFSFLNIIKRKLSRKLSQIELNTRNENTLLCYTLLSFILKRKCIIEKNELEEYVKNKLFEKEDKIISVFENYDQINQYNYSTKFNELLNSNHCFIKIFDKKTNNELVNLNYKYINKEKDSIYNLIFGENLAEAYKKKAMSKKLNSLLLKINEDETNITNTNSKMENKNEEKRKNNNNEEISYKKKKKKKKKQKNCEINNEEKIIKYNVPKEKSSIFSEDLFDIDNKNKNSSYTFISKNNLNYLISSIIENENQNSKEDKRIIFKPKEYKFTQKMLNIIQKAQEFLSLINSFNFDKISNDNTNLILLINYKNDKTLEKCITVAKNDYFNLIEYLKCFSGKKADDIINQQCSILIFKIYTKLSQFLLDYNFIMELINSNTSNNNLLIKTKGIDKENVLTQDNIEVLKIIMENEI